jgi:hypothetical protein
MLTPLFRALCAASLWNDGVLEPAVSATGDFRDESGELGSSNLFEVEGGPALILQALAFADAATGARIGSEVCQALAKQHGVSGLEAAFDVQRSSGHGDSYDLNDALHDAARFLAAQRSIEEAP